MSEAENKDLIHRLYEEVWNQHNPEAADDIDVAYSDERLCEGPWPSEASPSGMMTGVLGGEMSFYYGACWLHYRSAQRRDKTQ